MDNNALGKQFTASSLLRFALPNMVMMVFLSLYTIVDGMFVSRFVGTLALSATNMSYPLTSVQMAVGIMLSTGGSAIIARELGEGRTKDAREDFTCIVAVSLAVGVVFALLGNLFLEPILRFLGTSAAQFPICRDYTRILLCFAPALFLQTAFQTLFVTAGKPGLGLGTTVAGGLFNIVLDYVLMGPLNLGVSGAAVATGVSYLIPGVVGLAWFSRDRGGPLHFTSFRPKKRMLLQTCGNGSSEMVSNIASAITTLLFNLIFLGYWGEDGVAAITIIMYFQFVFTAVFFGFSMGVAPVISYQYGAQDTQQLKRVIRYCLIFVGVCSASSYLISQLVISFCLSIFTDPGSAVYALSLSGFPIFSLSFLVMGVSIFASSLFTAFSDGAVSAVISVARTFVFLVTMLLLLPQVFGEMGIWLAVPAAELLGLAVALWFLVRKRGKYQY